MPIELKKIQSPNISSDLLTLLLVPMEKKDKVCLTTFIYGIKYQGYIPFLVYSCHKAYPDYDIRLFLYEKLDESVKKQIDLIGANNVFFYENTFADCPNMNQLKARCLRWVLWNEAFLQYDYLYIVDIDMIYIREPLPLHKQHIEHMKTTGLPYDNLVRCFQRHPLKPRSIAFRIKHAGLLSFFKFLFGSRNDYRLTGLHFIEVKPYFSMYDINLINKYKQMVYDDSFLSLTMSSNDEAFLYQIMKQINLNPDKIAIQTESYKMLDFNNCSRPEFRPHHGIHMGIFRQDLRGKRKTILDCAVYQYYIQHFKKSYLPDPVFLHLYQIAPSFIKAQFTNFYNYYNIPAY